MDFLPMIRLGLGLDNGSAQLALVDLKLPLRSDTSDVPA
jgi:hypothetical protein